MNTKGRVIVVYDENNDHNLGGKLTLPVAVICIAISFAGFIYGYENGATVHVSKSATFVKKFFPAVAHKLLSHNDDEFCVFNSKMMLMYWSAPHVTAMFSAFMSGYLTTSAGRKGALMIGGVIYTIGTAIHASALNAQMLILARLIIGFGLGFTTHSSSIYMTEMAPTKWRGALGCCFQLFFSCGMLSSFIMNYAMTNKFGDNGWRITLGLCVFPGIIITIAAILVPDSPSSLIQRGKVQEALESLNKVRSRQVDVENELNFLIKYNEAVNTACEKPYHMLLERKYRPHVVLAILLPAFQHLTGNNNTTSNLILMFFRSLGFSRHQMFVRALVINVSIMLSVFVAIVLIDRVGRRAFLLQGSIQIMICQIGLGILVASQIAGKSGTLTSFSKESAIMGTILSVLIIFAFTWSWGPLPWFIPSELLPMEIRPAGQGLSVASNFFFRFIVSQITVPLLCQFKYGLFFIFGVLVLMMIVFVVLFVPETKRIPLESMDRVLHNHWYWQRFVGGTAPKM